MQIQKASEMDTSKIKYNFVIVGESGSGKSHSLMTFPKGWKVLVLDMFGNKETYAGDPDIEVISFSDLNPDASTAWPEIQSVKRELVKMLDSNKFRWDVIVTDTATGLTRFIENFILTTNPDGRGIGGAPAQHHYRGMANLTGKFITSFLAYPVINVINCHVSPPDQEGQIAHKAMLTGKVWRNSIYSYVHEVYNSRTHQYKDPATKEEGTQWAWQTQGDMRWPMLKSVLSRGGKYFGKMVEQNYSKLFYKRGLITKDLVKEPEL